MTAETTADRTEQSEHAVDEELILSEFRKAVSQLGELRRRETQLLRRVALLEHEQGQARTAFEYQSTEAGRLRNELAGAHSRAAELEGVLEAQARELQSIMNSASWRFTLPLRSFAMNFAGLRRQLKRLFTRSSAA
jgi:hypothetical protein